MGFLNKLLKVADTASGLNIIPGKDPTEGCDIMCGARIVAIADLPAEGDSETFEQQVSLLRLAVERPDGEHEACVRQDIPPQFQPTLVPGDRVTVRTHPVERGRAFVMWGNGPNGASIVLHSLLKWPEPDRWPQPGRIEVYKRSKRDEELAARRQQRQSLVGQLAGARPTSMKMNGRQVYEWVINTAHGPATLRQQGPDLAVARLMIMQAQWRFGAPVVLMVGEGGKDTEIDWEATIAQPANWRGGHG